MTASICLEHLQLERGIEPGPIELLFVLSSGHKYTGTESTRQNEEAGVIGAFAGGRGGLLEGVEERPGEVELAGRGVRGVAGLRRRPGARAGAQARGGCQSSVDAEVSGCMILWDGVSGNWNSLDLHGNPENE